MDPRQIAEPVLQELLGASAVLPEQFWPRQRGCQPSAERALMWAVFADGIECYRRNAHPVTVLQQLEFEDAERWVLRTDWDWPFSFVNLCAVFGFDATGVREALAEWRQRHGALRRQRFRQGTLRAA